MQRPWQGATGLIRSLFHLAMGLVVVLAVAGCSRGPRNFENENDRLRARTLELEKNVEDLQRRLDLRVAELRALEQRMQHTGSPAVAGVSPADIPALTSLHFDRYTGPLDTDGDGVDNLVRIYLQTFDQEGRVIPVAAQVWAQVVAIEPGQAPTVLAERIWSPRELDSTYREGITGTHYTLEMPLARVPQGVKSITLKVTVTDAATGLTVDHQQAYRLGGR